MSTGPTTYVRTKPGYHLPLHWHTHHEYATMIAGKAPTSSTADRGRARHFIIVPSRPSTNYLRWRRRVLFIIRRSGPTDYNWVAAK
jgi:hypothetical protein